MLSVVLAIPEATSLKDKRRVVRRVLDRARSKFDVAAAEVGTLDAHRKATLGFSVVSNDARHARSMLDTIAGFVAGISEATVVARRSAVEHRKDLEELGASEGAWSEAADDDDGSDDEEVR